MSIARSLRSIRAAIAIVALSTLALTTSGSSTARNDYDLAASNDAGAQSVDTSQQPSAPPPNDTFAGAIPLSVNMSMLGNLGSGADSATDDYQLAAPGSPTCYSGNGQQATPSNAAGRDVVYSFTAPSAGAYSFRVGFTGETDNENLVIYLVDGVPTGAAPVVIPCQASGAPPPVALAAANRNTVTTQPAEEIFNFQMSAGQQLFLVVDEAILGTTATAYYVEVFNAVVESEPNDTFASAQPIACGIEGTITNATGPVQDFDYFSIGTPPDGSRLFAILDAAATNSSNLDIRVNNVANTYQWSDFHNDIENGTTSGNIGGLALAAADGPYAIQVDYLGTTNTAVHEPYRLVYVIQPPSAAAIAETEPNDSLPTATSHMSNYFSGTFSALTDSDWYATAANAGDLLFVSLDNDPARNGNNPNGNFELYDTAGNLIYSLEDNSNITTAGFPPAAGQQATTPAAPAEATIFRIPTTGIYYVRLVAGSFNATGPNDYLLSIAKNCTTGGGGTVLPGAGSFQFGSATFSELEGRTATVTVSRTGGTTGAASVNYTTSNGSAIGGSSCGPGIDFIHTSGTLTFAEGDALESFMVTLCGDASAENDQTIGLTLSGPTGGATLGSPNPATLNVLDVATQFCNQVQIFIPATGTSPTSAAPYPSIINVSGLSGTVTGVRVTLPEAQHGNPDDLDILLVGPGGQNLILMSDAGGGAGLDAPATITLSDTAAAQIPDASTIATGSYRPTNHSTATDTFAAGAPAGPYGNPGPGAPAPNTATLASVFNGTNPNGDWQLFVSDDTAATNGGTIAGWCLELTTTAGAPLQLGAAVSRKTHGSAGTFDIPLTLTGEPAVESRSSGGDHTFVFIFNNNVVSGNASVTTGTGSVSGTPTFSGNTMTVNLTGVTDVQRITVTLNNVTDNFGQVLPATAVSVNMLVGDVNSSKSVNASDIGAVKAQSGLPVTAANFRSDVAVNGSINASDIGLVKSRSGQSVP
jgi:hypothetical protein